MLCSPASIKGACLLSIEGALTVSHRTSTLVLGSRNLDATKARHSFRAPDRILAVGPAIYAVNPMWRYRRLQRLFRCVEALAAVLLLSWYSTRLPAAARLSGDILRRLAAFLLSPRFVFLLGNAIILVLFAKSGHSYPSSSAASPPARGGDIYEEFVDRRRRMMQYSAAEVVYEDKKVCVEGRACRKIRSQRMERGPREPELRWSLTDVEGSVEKQPAASEEDAEEFRRTVDAFIAKQLRFRRQESMSMAVASSAEPDN